MKKTVLHVLSSNSFSGAENVALTIIKALEGQFNSCYCCPEGPIRDKLDAENVQYVSIKRNSVLDLRRVIKEIQPDVIHAHDYKASLLCALVSKNNNIVSHIHSDNQKVKKNNLFSLTFKLASKKYSKIIWVSEQSFKNYAYSNSIAKKSIVIKNCINQNEIRRKATAKKTSSYDILFLGRMSDIKNPTRFADIINIIHDNIDVKSVMIGGGELLDSTKKYISSKKLDDVIAVTGPLENPYPYLLHSKILLMTSKIEGAPMATLEALCLKKPVFSTPVSGNNETIINDYNGYLTDDNKTMAEKIIFYLNNKKEYDKLSKNAYTTFMKHYSFSKYSNQIKEIYDTIIAKE